MEGRDGEKSEGSWHTSYLLGVCHWRNLEKKLPKILGWNLLNYILASSRGFLSSNLSCFRSKGSFPHFFSSQFCLPSHIEPEVIFRFQGCDVAYWTTDATPFCEAFSLFEFIFFHIKVCVSPFSFFPWLLEAATLHSVFFSRESLGMYKREFLDWKDKSSSLTHFVE